MIGILLKLIYTRGLSIKRWSNFPRIEDITPLDNTGFVIHISLFLAYLEEKNWKKLDKEYMVKKILFDLFKALVLSDINSGTRDYINQVDISIMTRLEERVLNYLFSFDGGEFLKKDMDSVYSISSEKKLENNIILAAKKFAGYNECLVNSRVFLLAYDVAMEQIQEYFEENKKKLFCLRELMKNDNYKRYLGHIRRLSHCKRWSGKNRVYEVSVMSHLVMVTFLSYILGHIENENKGNYDILTLMLRSLYHDIPESITGDIITPTKKAISGFHEVLDEVERRMMNDYFFTCIDKDYKELIIPYMLHPFDSEEGSLAKKADIISAMFEAKIERDSGNHEFGDIYKRIKKDVNAFDLHSTNYILKDVIMSFEEDNNNLDLNEE